MLQSAKRLLDKIRRLQVSNSPGGHLASSQTRGIDPEAIPRQILIAGMAKTGTTGLFFKISNSLLACEEAASKTKLLFEPTSYSGAENERVVAKIIIQQKSLRPVSVEDFSSFDKKILLLRDPRDQMISGLLYLVQGMSFFSNAKKILSFLSLLKKKERDSRSVSVLELRAALWGGGSSSLAAWKNGITENLNYFLEFRRSQRDFFSYKYEDFIRGNTRELENFLGFPLTGNATVGKGLERVVRTKKSGDWQNWFLEEDISFFRPVFKDFMHELGYEDSWMLPERQVILPAHGSKYVKKNLCRKIFRLRG